MLNRDLPPAGVFPAFDVGASRIAGEEELREEAELADARALRAELAALDPAEAAAARSARGSRPPTSASRAEREPWRSSPASSSSS